MSFSFEKFWILCISFCCLVTSHSRISRLKTNKQHDHQKRGFSDLMGFEQEENHPTIPVVFVHFGRSEPYVWESIKAALTHKNEVFFLTDHEILIQHSQFHVVNLSTIETGPELHTFRTIYQPWGKNEPWERQNFERFFYLSSFMETNHYNKVLYVDSDVFVLFTATEALLQPGCDAMIKRDHSSCRYSYHWALWTGTAVLTPSVLFSFISFTLKTYSSDQYLQPLQLKNEKSPYVCDMTVWFLFGVCSHPNFLCSGTHRPFPTNLPSCPQLKFCELSDAFDDGLGRSKAGVNSLILGPWKFNQTSVTATVSNQPKKTLHFQGQSKVFLKEKKIRIPFPIDHSPLSFSLK